ncbi:MAG: hypothetical protein EZS28_013856 [Streblomastix strix]|uniref:Uncharacterized protein n=1 Tax=Streblomastix strix TaxID=222440 RepID=A0A5J4W756_9EUKA|nr:MAG: hypothetical protein EZS28_013856 [Streblomastix strix]
MELLKVCQVCQTIYNHVVPRDYLCIHIPRAHLLLRLSTLYQWGSVNQKYSQVANILSFVIMVDEAVASEDTIGLSMNVASVGYSLRSSYPSQTQIPQFAFAMERFRQAVRNISQSQNIQLLNEHQQFTFAKLVRVSWKDVIGLPTELAKFGMRLSSGEMVQTTNIVSMEDPLMIYEVANAMIDEILL